MWSGGTSEAIGPRCRTCSSRTGATVRGGEGQGFRVALGRVARPVDVGDGAGGDVGVGALLRIGTLVGVSTAGAVAVGSSVTVVEGGSGGAGAVAVGDSVTVTEGDGRGADAVVAADAVGGAAVASGTPPPHAEVVMTKARP